MTKIIPYNFFFNQVLETINLSKYNAYKQINRFHIEQNFVIGRLIVVNQQKYRWGDSIVDALSKDINKVVDGVKGFSTQNLWKMRQFFLEYKDNNELLKLALKIPWSHNILIINKIKNEEERKYYLTATDQMGWSRAVLLNQIKANAFQFHSKNKKITNFEKALSTHLSEQANEALKSEYNLDFLGITKPILERDLENRLIEKIRDFLLELGYGFTFIGNQYKLKLDDKFYYIDLLFYHRFLKCLVAIELKTVEFEPEFAGKMNFYLELLDEQEKAPDDNPSIGIILCPEKNNIEVEYALRIVSKPIGVAEYKLTRTLPKDLKGKVPSISELKKLLTIAIENDFIDKE